MAYFFNHNNCIPLYLILILTIISTAISASARPESVLLTITKDISTSQYTTKVLQRNPPVSVSLTLDLSTPNVWLNCGRGYVSSTYKPVNCGSRLCTFANATICRSCPSPPGPKPGCQKNTCRAIITNPITKNSTSPKGSELALDVIQVNTSEGASITGVASAPNILFFCASTSLLGGLAKGVKGVAGFGRSKPSFPTQLSSTLGLTQVFALCLPRRSQQGFAFLGSGPYYLLHPSSGYYLDLRTKLTYTPLITNPARPTEYFIRVQAIRVASQDVPINKTLLSIDSNGIGGTSISLSYPYTAMEPSIYKAVTTHFDDAVKSLFPETKRVFPVAPFEFCYDTFYQDYGRGPHTHEIELVLKPQWGVMWTIKSWNSIVSTNYAYCLGIVNGGKNLKPAIVIGGYQLEDNLLEFDRSKSRLGFTSPALVYDEMRCSAFNFKG